MKLKIYLLAIILTFSTFNNFANETDSTKLLIEQIENSFLYRFDTIEFKKENAKLIVPQGFRYLDAEQSRYVLSTLWGNPVDSSILGLLVPVNRGVLAPNSWVFTISFDEIGYVKDDDAESIDYDELLTEMQKETKEGNANRTTLGYQPIELLGWASKPYYDNDKKVLHWTKELKFGTDSLNTLNYNLRILGKNGVFVLNAVSTISELPEVNQNINNVLGSIDFEKGSSYSDFNPEVDKIAAWSIGGLVAGKVLAKVGFFAVFAKFAKVIVLGIVAVGGIIWKFLSGKKKEKNNL